MRFSTGDLHIGHHWLGTPIDWKRDCFHTFADLAVESVTTRWGHLLIGNQVLALGGDEGAGGHHSLGTPIDWKRGPARMGARG